MWAFFGAWAQGATLFLDGDTSPFDPDRTVRLLQEHPITTFCGVPIIYRQLAGRGSDAFVGKFPKALKHCTSAGENLASRVIMDWQIWYMTGDRAHSDEYGYFFYKGRGDDVIILPAIGLASLHH